MVKTVWKLINKLNNMVLDFIYCSTSKCIPQLENKEHFTNEVTLEYIKIVSFNSERTSMACWCTLLDLLLYLAWVHNLSSK